MIAEFTKADGQLCHVQERSDGLFNIESEEGLTTWGVTAEEIERQIEMEKHKIFAAQYVAPPEPAPLRQKKAQYIPGTKIRQIDSAEKKDLIDWVEQHYRIFTLECSVANFARLAANLKTINGQDFTPGMDGFHELIGDVWGIKSRIDLDTEIPANLMLDVYEMQNRQGCRRDDEPATNLRVVFCVELAWELLRRGHKLGARR
jgi:hypothetical protein